MLFERRYQSAHSKPINRNSTAKEMARPEIHATTSALIGRPNQEIETTADNKLETRNLFKSKNASKPFAQCKTRFVKWKPIASSPQSERSMAKLNQNSGL